jgi:outer membrane protein assembly factor BamD
MVSAIRFLLLVLVLGLGGQASAAWWWPFGSSGDRLPAAEQTARARKFFEAGVADRHEGNLRAAARNLKKVWEDYPGSDFADEALFQYGEITFERKAWNKAFFAFQTLLQRHPEYPSFDQVVHYQFQIALKAAAGENIRWAYVIPFRAWERSIGYFEILIQNAPYSDVAPLALMNVALIHQYLGNTVAAVDALDRLINLYPESMLADDAYLELGHTFASLNDGPYYDQGSTREAQSYYEDFLVLFPQHPKVKEGEDGLSDMRNSYAESKIVIGEYYYHHRNFYRAAEIFFNEAITLAPESEAALKARAYLNRIEEFKARAAADPDYRPPATTWADRIFFWRSRETDLTEADAKAAEARVDAEASPDSPGISTPPRE